MSENGSITSDPWQGLRRFTDARIALGRAGGSLTTAELLRFRADHALARDAVHAELDVEALTRQLEPLGEPIVAVETRAPDLATYLRRPDLGRALGDASRERLATLTDDSRSYDISIVVADGLSATAAQSHAATLLTALVPRLRSAGNLLAPIVIARRARVALQDEIGAIFHATIGLILLGERPGMGAPDSLGAYLVYAPCVGRTDAERNCVSNIRPAGLPPIAAAETLSHLIEQSLHRRLSGVELKDERAVLRSPPPLAGER